MQRIFRDYGLSIALASLFIGSWFVQSIAGWFQFVAEEQMHGETAALFGPSGYIWTWLESTFENWQSEFLQLFTMVVLTAFLIHRHSHESRDEQDQMKAQIEEILARLKGEEK